MSTRIHAAFTRSALALALALAGCAGEASAPPEDVGTDPAPATAASPLTGRWQFVYTDARRRSVEEELSKKITDPSALAAAKDDAAAEAAASVIEFTAGGEFVSRIGDKEIARMPYRAQPSGDGELTLATAVGDEEKKTTATLRGDELTIRDPRKGELSFRRIAATSSR